jgi:hypothetical protein
LRGARLLREHHVARHCRKNDMTWNLVSGAPDRVLESAFQPRPGGDDDGLSTMWLECFGGDRSHNITQVRKYNKLKVNRSNKLAVVNVGNVEIAGNAAGLHAVADPDDPPCPPGNPAHALIKDPAHLQDQKLREAIAFTVQAGDIESYF